MKRGQWGYSGGSGRDYGGGGGHRDYGGSRDHGGRLNRDYNAPHPRDYGPPRDHGSRSNRDYNVPHMPRDYDGGPRDHGGGRSNRVFNAPRDFGGGGGMSSRDHRHRRYSGDRNNEMGGEGGCGENFSSAMPPQPVGEENASSSQKLVLYPSSKKAVIKNEKISIQPILVKKQKYKEITLFEYTCRNDTVEPKSALQDILSLIELKTTDDENVRKKFLADKPYLNFYLGQKGAMTMFREEIDEQLIQGDPNVAAVLAAASDMIPRFARMAGEQKQLNHFITALTASECGSNTKNLTFKTYANKLNGDKDYLKAACFYFGAFDAHRGIRCLLDAKCLRDAVLVAKIRLSPTDDLYREAHELWGIKYGTDRCHEAAAKSYISANDFGAAAEALMKRDTPIALQVSVQLALKGDKKELALTTAVRCIYMSMLENSWNVGLMVIDLCPELEPWRYVMYLHEGLLYVLTQALAPLMIDAFQVDLKIFGEHVHNLNRNQDNFVHSMWHLWLDKGHLNPDPENLQKMVTLLSTYPNSQNMNSLKAILPNISASLATGLFHLPSDRVKTLNCFGSSLELVSLFSDVAAVLGKIINNFDASNEEKCCDVQTALCALSLTPGFPSDTGVLTPVEGVVGVANEDEEIVAVDVAEEILSDDDNNEEVVAEPAAVAVEAAEEKEEEEKKSDDGDVVEIISSD